VSISECPMPSNSLAELGALCTFWSCHAVGIMQGNGSDDAPYIYRRRRRDGSYVDHQSANLRQPGSYRRLGTTKAVATPRDMLRHAAGRQALHRIVNDTATLQLWGTDTNRCRDPVLTSAWMILDIRTRTEAAVRATMYFLQHAVE
jgi:hypothetical protein